MALIESDVEMNSCKLYLTKKLFIMTFDDN